MHPVQSDVEPIELPWQQIPADTLRRLVEELVTREAGDSGFEVPLEAKTREVVRHLESGRASILFDPVNETCSLQLRR